MLITDDNYVVYLWPAEKDGKHCDYSTVLSLTSADTEPWSLEHTNNLA